MNGSVVTVCTELDEQQVHEISVLTERVTESDGVRPLSEHSMLHVLAGTGDGFVHLLSRLSSKLVGYAALSTADAPGPSMEIAVAQSARSLGVGEALLDRALVQTDGHLSVWAHGRHAFISELAVSRGFAQERQLLRMRRTLLGTLPQAPVVEGVLIRTFVPGVDEAEWLGINARAFVDLPDQGGWQLSDLRLRMGESWFDPCGFFVAVDADSGRMIGFHWTKVHRGDSVEPVGEIYVIGVDPAAGRQGLGRALSLAGMRYLQSLGLKEVMLYVDAANSAAQALYERLGFVVYDSDTLFRSPVPARAS